MARIINNKLLFIHVAKTGGTYVREMVNALGIPNYESGSFEIEDHHSIKEVDEKYFHLISFGIVREPIEWLVSRWKWGVVSQFEEKVMGGTDARYHWMAKVFSQSVNVFLENVAQHCPNKPQEYMFDMLGISGEKKVSYLMTTNQLDRHFFELLNTFCGVSAIDFREAKKLVTNTKEVNITIKPHCRLALAEIRDNNKELIKLVKSINEN